MALLATYIMGRKKEKIETRVNDKPSSIFVKGEKKRSTTLVHNNPLELCEVDAQPQWKQIQ